LDLPIKYKDTVYNFIIVKHKDVKAYKWIQKLKILRCKQEEVTTQR
jgi:hypothetical protein